ncbi:bifunctional glutamate N-acetyltransferase/amino-acid acetyltransferase ArgJ [Streptomyces sp. NPDC049881]|uniref:bifunctional glutamate N-acetyltransferase/amino-acid acetyltransferase ArgJ n=1 Tax=unclassified Streptomyces TaxID=2593676 RepID=UPI0034427CF2
MSNTDAVAWPAGFRAVTAHAGLRDEGDDLSVIVSDLPSVSAAMFTRSRFAGPSVVLSRRHAAGRRLRAIVTVAKNANVATGAQGAADAAEIAGHVADALGVAADEVLISSTGVIGRPLPMDPIRARLTGPWGPFDATPLTVARAMMTTDTRPKTAERAVGGARIVGVAKGVGMIEPDMATMLAYLVTDAALTPEELDGALRAAVDETFNSLSVDTDTSTSDTVAVLASGAAGPVDVAEFTAALRAVCLDLTEQLARDGEGASKLLRVTVEGARDRAQAKRIAKSVVNSPLVKTAVHGADPNWGRVVMAIGKNADDTDIDQEKVTVRFGAVEVYPAEQTDEVLAGLTRVMSQDEVDIGVTLGIADGRATVYGCDLTDGYIRINADYTT